MNKMTAFMCTVWTASTDDPIKMTVMKNLEIELKLSLLGSVLAICMSPWFQCSELPGKQRENIEIETGMVVHSCNLNTREAEVPDLYEFKASLLHIARLRPA